MKLTITNEDLQTALEEYRTKRITECCLIFQAAKRAGLQPRFVTDVEIVGAKYHVLYNARPITTASPAEWSQFVGQTVEISD